MTCQSHCSVIVSRLFINPPVSPFFLPKARLNDTVGQASLLEKGDDLMSGFFRDQLTFNI